jgi:hypothetical protein
MVEMNYEWVKVVFLEIPNFNAPIVGNRGEHRRSVWGPLDVVYLLFVGHLMANELLVDLLGLPDSHGPIVRACHEDWALNRVPEWVATNLVDRACVAIVGLIVLFRVRD